MHSLSQSPRDPAFVQDPYPFYHRARALGPLFLWEDYGFPCAAGHAEVGALLRDRRFGRELPADLKPPRPPHLADFYALDDRSMLDREPPAHTRLRGLVLRAFTSRRIAALEPGIASLAHELIDRLKRPEFDLLTGFAEPLPVVVIARLLGVPEAMSGQLLAWSHAMVAMYQARRDRAVEERANAAATDFAAFLRAHVAARRTRPGDDLITELIAAEREGDRLDTDELVATCVLLLNAGHEATVHAIGNGVAAILAAGCDAGADLRRRRRDGGHGRGGAALRSAAPPLHPRGPRRRRGLRPPLPPRRRRSAACSRPPTATRRASPSRTGSTRPGLLPRTSPSAPASTSASARRSPGSSWRSRCRSSSRAFPASRWPRRRSSPTATTSTGSRPFGSAHDERAGAQGAARTSRRKSAPARRASAVAVSSKWSGLNAERTS